MKKSISMLTKTQVMYPSSIELVIDRLEALVASVELFFFLTERSFFDRRVRQAFIDE